MSPCDVLARDVIGNTSARDGGDGRLRSSEVLLAARTSGVVQRGAFLGVPQQTEARTFDSTVNEPLLVLHSRNGCLVLCTKRNIVMPVGSPCDDRVPCSRRIARVR